MKTIKRPLITAILAVLVLVVALTTGWPTADAGSPPQETAEGPEATTEEPLPDFQPTERLPADSAVAFPTDI
ncbi:MAG: hypothetical protein IFK93_02100 [Acidobacteria bacterium]|jgi:hypothetical protein|uniref:Uncharacterized protein n=1 Tax=Candidatus Sulfomarinibacter kjeldsenii TaxID=2885994 RepID=A0A8J6XZN0_9BACT|nr:hypothetical protein [Candidatus Sulfomarinibacter kjeldsenii]MBD3855742.1 hypothetical protein [Candidatus Sulfomarinibacter kjeldsenii]MBD3870578.1 hypothetical protein [Candidatus Sulfomarinibacter kjeldsenii]